MHSVVIYDDHELVEDGSDCVNLISSGVIPDILLLDIAMPYSKLDGYEVAQIIKVNYPSIIIIFISIYDSLESVKAMIRLGASALIPKTHPFFYTYHRANYTL